MIDYRLDGEVRIPGLALCALSAEADRGGEPVAAAVRAAGRAAGDAIAGHIAGMVPLTDLDTDDFLAAVNAETAARGLGTLVWRRELGTYAEVVVREAPELAEPVPGAGTQPGTPFTEGFLEGLLGAAAEEPVGVVRTPDDGGEGVHFIVGSPSLLRHVRIRLDRGETLEEALEGI